MLVCGVYIKPSWIKNDISINADRSYPAASLIKIPLAVVLLQEIDKGKISWNDYVVFKPYHTSPGSGIIKLKKTGTKLKLKEVFKLMLTISDNTATNMVIDFLGGVKECNQKISRLGLKKTKLVSMLGDFKGSNKTSPRDMVLIFENALEGDLLSASSKKALKKTLLKVQNTSLIKRGLGHYTKFPHKTGTIGICLGDGGIIYLPFWERVGISIIVERPFNDLRAKKLINEISKLVYKELI